MAVLPLSLEASLDGVLCRVAIAFAACSRGGPDCSSLALAWHFVLEFALSRDPVVNPRVRRLFSSSSLARRTREYSCSCSLLVVIPRSHVRLLDLPTS